MALYDLALNKEYLKLAIAAKTVILSEIRF